MVLVTVTRVHCSASSTSMGFSCIFRIKQFKAHQRKHNVVKAHTSTICRTLRAIIKCTIAPPLPPGTITTIPNVLVLQCWGSYKRIQKSIKMFYNYVCILLVSTIAYQTYFPHLLLPDIFIYLTCHMMGGNRCSRHSWWSTETYIFYPLRY